MESGAMTFAGKYSEPDYETLVDGDCDLAIESTMILHTPKVQEMIEDLGIPVFVDYSSCLLYTSTVIPPFLIISILSAGYQAFRSNQIISLMLEGMQAGVGAVIASVTYDMGAGIVKKKDALSYVLMVGAFIASCIFEVNVVYVILICGIVGVLRALIEKKITRKGSEEK